MDLDKGNILVKRKFEKCPVCEKNDKTRRASKNLLAPQEPSINKFGPTMTYLSWGLGIFGILWFLGFFLFGEITFNTILTTILTVGAFLYFLFLRRRYVKVEYPSLKTGWESAMKRYERMQYCLRDDIYFDPQSGATFNQETAEKFLYHKS